MVTRSRDLTLGRYQKLALLGLIIPGLAAFFVIMMMPLMEETPGLLCEQTDKTWISCTKEYVCSTSPAPRYQVNPDGSWVNWVYDFGLLCDKTVSFDMIYYFCVAGFFIGAVVITPIADYIGRKSILILSATMLCIIYLKFVFTTNVTSCACTMFFLGIFIGAYYCTALVYLTETATQSAAVTYATMFHLALPVSGAISIALLHALDDWKVVVTIMAFVPLVLIGYIAYIAESPRYLAAKRQYDDARISANAIAMCNISKKRTWEFPGEGAEYTAEYVQFANVRDKMIYQHCLLLTYSSTRYYLFAFFVLLFCSGFSFAGLALMQEQIFPNEYFNNLALYGVEFLMLFFSGHFIQLFGHIKTIFLALACTGGCGVVTTLLIWISDYLHGVSAYLMKLFSMMAFVASISLAAENCPARVRATGFGMSVGAAVIGLAAGGFVRQFYDNHHIVFGIVALASILILGFIKNPESYVTNDDVFEIHDASKSVEKSGKKKAAPSDSAKEMEPLITAAPVDSPAAAPTAPAVPVPEEKKAATPAPVPVQVGSTVCKIEGTRKVGDKSVPMGVESIQFSTKGEIEASGKDEEGEFKISGEIKKGCKAHMVQKYTQGDKEVSYEGVLEGTKLSGKWTLKEQTDEFTLVFKMKLWRGDLEVHEGESKPTEWLMNRDSDKITGFGRADKLGFFFAGPLQDAGKLTLNVLTEKDESMVFEGTLSEAAIEGKLGQFSAKLNAVSDA